MAYPWGPRSAVGALQASPQPTVGALQASPQSTVGALQASPQSTVGVTAICNHLISLGSHRTNNPIALDPTAGDAEGSAIRL